MWTNQHLISDYTSHILAPGQLPASYTETGVNRLASFAAINSLFLLNRYLFLCQIAIRDFFIADLNKLRRQCISKFMCITAEEMKYSANIRTLLSSRLFLFLR